MLRNANTLLYAVCRIDEPFWRENPELAKRVRVIIAADFDERLLATALHLHQQDVKEFHGYSLRSAWDTAGDVAAMNYATVYRCLDRLEERGLLSSRYDIETKGGGPPRRLFTLTGEGLRTATSLTNDSAATPLSIRTNPT